MNVLVLCDRYPYPLENGQSLRIFHYVRQLIERHTFDLVCYADSPSPPEIRPLFRSIRTFPRPQGERASGLKRFHLALRVDEFLPRSSEVASLLDSKGSTADWDLVWISGWDMVVNLPRDFRVPVLMDAVDDGVLEHGRELRQARSLPQVARTLKRLVMNYRFERKYFGNADACLFVSDVDARFFSRISPRTPTFVVQNGVDVDYFKPSSPTATQAMLVFEGNMSFPPNEDAAAYLVNSIFPLVLRRAPGARLLIVGKAPSAAVKALAGPNVEVTGFVPDVRPFLDEATVFVCPMRKGAGIKNKVLQAWAMGKPVVATSNAVGGLAAREGENIVTRDDAESFADAVVELLRSPEKRAAMSAAARRTVEANYTWERQARALEDVMLRTVATPRAPVHA